MLVIQSLRQLEQVRNKRITDSLYDNIPIPVPINIGTINGGAWPSSVADTVTLEGRCGIAPNESPEAVQSELENWLNDLQYHDEWFKHYPVDIEWFGAMWLPNDLAEDHELTKVLKSAYQTITAEAPLIEASRGRQTAEYCRTPEAPCHRLRAGRNENGPPGKRIH